MSIRVIDGKITHSDETFGIGSIITGLSEKEETRLISLGFAEQIPEEKKSKEVNPYDGKNAEEMIAIIESMDSEDELKAIFEFEQKGKNRKTIFQAIEAKMEAMNNKGHDPEDPNNDGIGLNFNPDDVIKQSSDQNGNV